jgi:prolyl oligopeptidase
VTWLVPSYDRALLSLSRGGGDAVVVREFNVETKSFVADGFNLPEAKSDVSWRDADTIFVGTDFGAGSQTSSGYPRITKEWKRGTPLTEAKTLFEGQVDDVEVSTGIRVARWMSSRAGPRSSTARCTFWTVTTSRSSSR